MPHLCLNQQPGHILFPCPPDTVTEAIRSERGAQGSKRREMVKNTKPSPEAPDPDGRLAGEVSRWHTPAGAGVGWRVCAPSRASSAQQQLTVVMFLIKPKVVRSWGVFLRESGNLESYANSPDWIVKYSWLSKPRWVKNKWINPVILFCNLFSLYL